LVALLDFNFLSYICCNELITFWLKQHASKFMLIFMKILKILIKVKYCEVNKVIQLLHTALTIHVNYQKEVKICKNSPYCIVQLVAVCGDKYSKSVIYWTHIVTWILNNYSLSTFFSSLIFWKYLVDLEACSFKSKITLSVHCIFIDNIIYTDGIPFDNRIMICET
jgi:hypothetical protein